MLRCPAILFLGTKGSYNCRPIMSRSWFKGIKAGTGGAVHGTEAKQKPKLKTVRYAFRTIIWPRRWLVLLGIGLILVNRLSGLVLPGASKYLVDNVIGNSDLELLRLLLVAVSGAILVQSVSSFFLTRLLSVEAQNLISQLRVKVQRQVIHFPVRYFDNHKSGELISRIMSDVEGVRNLIGTGLVQLFGGLLTAVVALGLLLRINATMTLYALVPMVVFGGIMLKAFGYIRPIFRRRRVINAEVTGRLNESLGGIRVIKGFNAEPQEIHTFELGVDRLFRNVRKSLTATSLVSSSATLLLGISGAAIMGLGALMIIRGRMTVGDFFAFTLYLGFLISPILQMSNIGSQITDAFAGLDRMEEVLNLPREADDPARTVTIGPVEGKIVFENVVFSYEEGKVVIDDISFEAPAGSVTALVGSSGSGKTTIAGLAASFIQPDRGVVRVDGVDLGTVVLDSYRSQLGVVLQDDFLFDGTIRENILFADPGADEQRVQAAAAAAHVSEFTDRFEEGLETVIGERGVKLSGGQRQRVAIARAMLADPRVLVLDEATSSLDSESEVLVQDSFKRLLAGRTTFVIAHRLSTIRRADQILVVEKGKIAERGTHAELVDAGGRYQELHEFQGRI